MAFREPIYFNDHTLKHQAGGMQEITPPSAEQSPSTIYPSKDTIQTKGLSRTLLGRHQLGSI